MSGFPADLSAVKLALLANRFRAEAEGIDLLRSDPIAIVGIGCRFPGGVDSPDSFWDLLARGADAVVEMPPERVALGSLAGTAGSGANVRGGFLDHRIDLFDPAFFGLSRTEASRLDPQQRLLLEVAWEALEDAGLRPGGLAGSPTGVFVGLSSIDLPVLAGRDLDRLREIGPGLSHNMAANRLSYFLDLAGPSLEVDAACSSSLVAVHLACNHLRSGECDLALAGGVSLMLVPELWEVYANLGLLAEDGRCKAFDAAADGFGRGEGCGLVVLKRLSDALADRDPIRAVLRGSAVNQNGLSNGITAPNGLAQRQVFQRALENAGISPERLGYIEAHGTGTPLGDLIEIEALAEVLGGGDGEPWCALGSVKTNIAHLEAAAGIASLIKAALVLERGAIPPSLHCRTLHPEIARLRTPFAFPRELRPWPAERPRLAGVHCVGIGGTNAHAILEAAPSTPWQEPSPADLELDVHGPVRFLPLSGHTADVLRERVRSLRDFLERRGRRLPLADVCYTVGVRRSHHPLRLAVLARSAAEMADVLSRALDEGGDLAGRVLGRAEGPPAEAADLWAQGECPDWSRLYPDEGRQVRLPRYPYQLAVCWWRDTPAQALAAPRPAAEPARRAAPGGEQLRLEDSIRELVARRLGLVDPAEVDPRRPLGEQGLDSRGALELRNALSVLAGRPLTAALIFNYPTVEALAELLSQEAGSPQARGLDLPARTRVANAADPIAVIGVGCRFPGGADGPAAFWELLCAGRDAVTVVPAERWNVDAYYDPDPHRRGTMSTRWGSFLPAIDHFDAPFFQIAPREAAAMDPQQRLLLEVAWEALEHAGVDPSQLNGAAAGVFVGMCSNSHWDMHMAHGGAGGLDSDFVIGNLPSIAAGRLSYLLGLHGPSLTLDTACSSSLVAVHLACQSLQRGESDLALAGGVNLILSPEGHILSSRLGVMARDGRCKTFDAAADGYSRGEGCGMVVLKRLSDALADGDPILAVVRGTAVNQDGRCSALTAPNGRAQEEVLRAALENAGLPPAAIGYVEAHGSGTPLGDVIELGALGSLLGRERPTDSPLLVGSVKTNFGHLEAAAGIAGFIKAALAVAHGRVPPHLHLRDPNPEVPFEELRLRVPAVLEPWPLNGGPRRAGVSSFGLSGTNAHVILEEAPASRPSSPSRPWQLLVLSAKTEGALDGATARLSDHLRRNPGLSLADVAYTLQVGRPAFPYRRIVVASETAGAAEALSTLEPCVVLAGCAERRDRPVLFLLPGLGDHYPGMGQGLYETEPLFRETVEHCCEILRPELGLDLREVLYPARLASPGEAGPGEGIDLRGMLRRSTESADPAADRLNQTWLAQPAVFVIGYALARLWMAWGIAPRGVLGYSLGEYVAACLAGVFSLEDSLRLVARRARLIQELPLGGMLAVPLPETALQPYLAPEISLAAVNGPSFSVLAGPLGPIEDLEHRLGEEGIACRRLPTTHAFHSSMMEPVAARLSRLMAGLRLQPPSLPYISNVSGDWIRPDEATDPRYWARHLCEPVRFADGLRTLAGDHPDRLLLEVGPGQSLGSIARQQGEDGGDPVVLPSLRAPYERHEDLPYLLLTLGKLWLAGARPNWTSLYRGEARRRLQLPSYAFERKRYWIEPRSAALPALPARGKKGDVGEWFYLPVWKPSPLPVEEPVAEGDLGWIIFVDDGSLCRGLLQRLRSRERVIAVRAGEVFERIGPDEYVIDPRNAGEYDRLLESLLAAEGPRKIAHLWSAAPLPEREEERFERAQADGFFSLLYLAQAVGRRNVIDPLRLCVLSTGAVQVSGFERLYPERATLAGPCRVIPQELLNVTCRAIDVELPAPGSWREERLVERLAAELSQQRSDLRVAYRREDRWVEHLDPVRLDGAPGRRPMLREEGVYLITGGLGGVGLILAEHLARKYRAKLVLTGRSGLPPRERWPELLAGAPEEDPHARRIRKVLELEESGAEILVLAADAADEAQMRSVLAEIRGRFGALHGVVHSAGLADERVFLPLPEISPAECAAQFRPKVGGVQVLERVLRGEKPDFVLLISSLSAVLGGLGFAAYASANAFMDLFAQLQGRDSQVPWISVDWDSWPSRDDQYAVLGGTISEFTMSREEGAEAFERVLTGAIGPLIVHSTGDLQARIDQWVNLEGSRQDASLESAPHNRGRLDERPELTTRYVSPANEVERRVAELWQGLLGIARVGTHDNFFELGGHSLLATQLFSQIRRAFRVDLPLRAIFEAPTVSALALLITGSQGTAQLALEPPAIVQVERSGEIPLSFSQQRHWFLHHLESDSRLFNEIGALELRGDLDVAAFIESVNDLVRRHEVLRTVFPAAADGQPVQILRDEVRIEVPVIDLGDLDDDRAQAQLQRILRAEVQHSFDLGEGPLVRCTLTRTGRHRHVAVVNAHHIVTDGVSMAIFRRELAESYTARSQGRPPALKEPAIQYADFACWQRRWLRGEVLEHHLAYWKRQLAGAIPTIDLPTDRPRPRLPDFRGARQPVAISGRLTDRLRTLSQDAGVTLFTTLAAGFLTLLHSYSGQDDITLGAPVASRGRVEIADVFGCFINVLPLRVEMSGDPRFRELLARAKETVLGALAHEELPFEKLVEELNPERSRSQWPLFQVVLNYQSEWLDVPSLHGVEAELIHLDSLMPSKYLLMLYLREEGGVLAGSLSYQTALFEPATIERMAGRFVGMLEQVVANPDVRLSKLSLLSENDGRRRKKDNDHDELKKLLGVRRRAVDLAPPPSS